MLQEGHQQGYHEKMVRAMTPYSFESSLRPVMTIHQRHSHVLARMKAYAFDMDVAI